MTVLKNVQLNTNSNKVQFISYVNRVCFTRFYMENRVVHFFLVADKKCNNANHLPNTLSRTCFGESSDLKAKISKLFRLQTWDFYSTRGLKIYCNLRIFTIIIQLFRRVIRTR